VQKENKNCEAHCVKGKACDLTCVDDPENLKKHKVYLFGGSSGI
jgi:hypothetical protein